MTKTYVSYVMLITALAACDVVEVEETSSVADPLWTMQGRELQGINIQGASLAGMVIQGFRFDSGTLAGAPLSNLRVERGELVAESGATTLRGTSLTGAHVFAAMRNLAAGTSALVEYQITAIAAEVAQYDPTHTGNTYLYTLEQLVSETGTWQPACTADADQRTAAIPLTAIWDEKGGRVESSSMFTFSCTTGVVAKCYRWGYRPWVTGFGDLVSTHWACTRMARADYCGVGVSNTRSNTQINFWDGLPTPIQAHGTTPTGMLFEAGWDTNGAVCLSHSRWLLDDLLVLIALCPQRLVPPGLLGTVCDTVPQVLGFSANARIYNEAYLKLGILGL
jgi:hypothetical protein